LVLKTKSKVPFMENACCNEDVNTVAFHKYFQLEDNNIEVYMNHSNRISVMLDDIRQLSKAAIYYDPHFTGLKYASIPSGYLEENIYAAFIHYCNFDRNLPVPENYRLVCSEKPVNYIKIWSIQEKVEFLKKNGKRYSIENLHQLMSLVHNNNLVFLDPVHKFTKVDSFRDIIDSLDLMNCSTIIEEPIRRHFRAILEKYNPKQMHNEDTPELENLKDYLYGTNKLLLDGIMEFFDSYGKLTNHQYDDLYDYLSNISSFTEYSLHSLYQYIQNAVYSMSKVYPSIIRNEALHNKVPKHWGLSVADSYKVEKNIIDNHYQKLEKFKGDDIITKLMEEVSLRLIDLNQFIRVLPIITPIRKDSVEFYSLFDESTIRSLFAYCFYCVLCEYICATDDRDLLRMDIEAFKETRRQNIRTMTDDSLQVSAEYTTLDENLMEEEDDLQEQRIISGNIDELKSRVCELLLAFLDIEEKNKKVIEVSYSTIMTKIKKSKIAEKKSITDYLYDLSIERRKVENELKNYKIGRWNVGLQKGLVSYDAETNERETNELIDQIMKENGSDDIFAQMAMDVHDIEIVEVEVDDIEKEDEKNQVEEEEQEMYDIRGLGSNYADGNHYAEDQYDDDADDFGDY